MNITPRAGEIFYLTKDEPYQIITLGIHKDTCESMVIYQALFGDYCTYVLPLSKFMEEIKGESKKVAADVLDEDLDKHNPITIEEAYPTNDKVNQILLDFLDEDSYSKKLDIITSHMKAIDDRLVNDMAASLDCTIEDGPVSDRIQELIYCLKHLSRFEVNRR